MPARLKILVAEDSAADAELALRALQQAGLDFDHRVVEDETGFRRAIADFAPDVILSDFSMPRFDGMDALAVARELAPDTPFIFVSGTIGEAYAIEALKSGAVDYVLKHNLMRLGPAVQRAWQEAQERAARRKIETELAAARERLESIVTSLQDVVWSVELPSGKVLYASPATRALYGRAPEEFAKRPGLRFEAVHPEDRRRVAGAWEAFLAGGVYDLEYRIVRPDGSTRWVHDRARRVTDATGAPVRADGIARDITERMEQQLRLARLDRLREMLSGINSAIIRLRDRQALFEAVAGIATQQGGFRAAWIGEIDKETRDVRPVALRGLPEGFFEGVKLAALPGADWPTYLAEVAARNRDAVIANNLEARTKCAYAQHALRPSGAGTAPPSAGAPERGAGAPPGGDATAKARASPAGCGALPPASGSHLRPSGAGTAPPSAGAPERGAGAPPGGDATAKARASPAGCGALPPASGSHLRPSGAGTAPPSAGARSAACFPLTVEGEVVAVMVLHAAEAGFFDREEVRLTGKAGIAVYPTDGADAETLFRNAEAALKKAKRSGDRYLFYAPAFNARASEQLALETRLRRAVEREEFVLFYQPKVSLRSGAVVGLEALLRWNDPEKGLVPPLQFIYALEETGLIVAVGRWALLRAACDFAALARRLGRSIPVAVNVSALQLRQPDFVPAVKEAVQACAPLDRGIEIEITESLVMQDVRQSIRRLWQVRELGVAIAMDDFGTGYSSLNYLSKLPLDGVKIDRSFIMEMESDAESMAVVSAIVSLAHGLKLTVTAEGVETEGQRECLRHLGCDQIQGYVFSPPVPLDRVLELLTGGQAQA